MTAVSQKYPEIMAMFAKTWNAAVTWYKVIIIIIAAITAAICPELVLQASEKIHRFLFMVHFEVKNFFNNAYSNVH